MTSKRADRPNNKPKHGKPRAGLKDFRIIARNLPFSTTEDDVKEYFGRVGAIKEVRLPKCKDPRFPKSSAGFAFIQYSSRNVAREAVESLNFTTFKGRKIAVDWTVNKDEYISKSLEKNERQRMLAKAEKFVKPAASNEIKEEEESDDSEDASNVALKEEIKTENSDSDEDEKPPKKIAKKQPAKAEPIGEDFSDEDISGSEMGDESTQRPSSTASKKPERQAGNAVAEGRVVFLRNLSFDTTNDSLKEQISQFGDVKLAIICKFPDTDQPTGNAFVHFKEKESADRCLQELGASGLLIDSRAVAGHRAVPREEAEKFKTKDKKGKDKRNLKLLRVSFIRAGTAQARGMSSEDSQLRRRLARAARTKLKNLHYFVSRTRLAIHNLPFKYRDSDLQALCTKHAPKRAKIIECRIMRNKTGKDKRGHVVLGKSKGFGFVEFTDHTDALTCLRNLNNNAEIFTNERRPIVEFSIENLQALKIQQKRRHQKH